MSVRDNYLPLRYNDSKMVLIAIDPYNIYTYWEIKKEDLKTHMNNIGEDFWNKSVPALKVTNLSKNHSFLININDNASDWYIHVKEPGSLYKAELGRHINNSFICVIGSNCALTPNNTVSKNNHVIFADCSQPLPQINLDNVTYSTVLYNFIYGLGSSEIYYKDSVSKESFLIYGYNGYSFYS